MATVELPVPKEERLLLRGIDFQTYLDFSAALADRPVRLTYDRGSLELRTLSHGHERCSDLLGLFVVVLTEELDMPRQSGGSTTFRREDLDRGLEPDMCFYLENEPLVRAKDDIVFKVRRPP